MGAKADSGPNYQKKGKVYMIDALLQRLEYIIPAEDNNSTKFG